LTANQFDFVLLLNGRLLNLQFIETADGLRGFVFQIKILTPESVSKMSTDDICGEFQGDLEPDNEQESVVGAVSQGEFEDMPPLIDEEEESESENEMSNETVVRIARGVVVRELLHRHMLLRISIVCNAYQLSEQLHNNLVQLHRLETQQRGYPHNHRMLHYLLGYLEREVEEED
jgi:hypothetical protein